ncbi:oxygen-dependent coproporphyrinogen oxidase [Tropicimonas sp.]|uniref:oxygen-dependent coproporphyrinogen oxidase n=1 Tax=Tropicimonas sp. TaxID=2067044 RepID=UPI003A8AF0C3
MTDDMEEQKARTAAWFGELRDRIVAAFEALEDSQTGGPRAAAPAGRFEVTKTRRAAPEGADAGGGLMSVMRAGRVFEKVGVNISTVHGELGETAQRAMAARGVPGMERDPTFWASGISLVAHMQNPHAPAVHMNTRMFWTPHAWWFGGGADLNPCIEYGEDTAAFHTLLRRACDDHDLDYYDRFKAWADEYFFVPHRGRARGVGGIFYDDLNTGDWEADFDFTRSVGEAFLPAFLLVTNRRRDTAWSQADKETQLVHRGLYAEYNLIYDRGTKFGLATGHDAGAVLMSLPPEAKWP